MRRRALLFLVLLVKSVISDYDESDGGNEAAPLCGRSKSEEKCICWQEKDILTSIPLYQIDCNRLNVTDFPAQKDLPGLIGNLDLSHNQITQLVRDASLTSRTLHYLDLSYNQIVMIQVNFFADTPNLYELDLSHNSIGLLSVDAFDGLFELRKLNLGFNKLKTLPDRVFSPLPKLDRLILSYNNVGPFLEKQSNIFASISLSLNPNISELFIDSINIKNISYGLLENAKSLRVITARDNPLSLLPIVPYSVEYLDVSGANISEITYKRLNYHSLKTLKLNRLENLRKITDYAFYNLQSLERLEINDCPHLEVFNPLAFDNKIQNSSLDYLSLARCGLKHINQTYYDLFKQLRTINLDDNPWKCDCGIKWFKKLNNTAFPTAIKCQSPPALQNKYLISIADRDFVCIKDVSAWELLKPWLITILVLLIIVLAVLVGILIYMGPFRYKNIFIGPDSPYHGITIVPKTHAYT